MGNEITKTYDIGNNNQSTSSGGHFYLWKVYSATKRSTNEQVSIFTLDKAGLEKQLPPASKKYTNEIFQRLKKGAQRLARVKHPSMLNVLQPVVEGKTDMFFVTEPVFASVGNILGHVSNIDSVTSKLQHYDMPLVEKQLGLFQVCEGLRFLHNDAQILHLTVSPANIFVTKKGDWKLAGFEFAVGGTCGDDDNRPWQQYNTSPYLCPPLIYAAPEYVNATQRQCEASDIFSLGLVTHELLTYNVGEPVSNHPPLLKQCNDISEYTSMLQHCLGSRPTYNEISYSITSAMNDMLSLHSTTRPASTALLNTSELLNTQEVKALRYLGGLLEKEPAKKVAFMNDLKGILPKFSNRLLRLKVIPQLVQELGDERLLKFVVPLLLLSLDKLQPHEYELLLLPHLSPLFQRVDQPQISEMLVQKLPILTEKSSSNIVKHYIVPFLCTQMKGNSSTQIACAVVKQATKMAKNRVLSYQDYKKDILPALVHTMGTSKESTVTCAVLDSITDLVDLMDRDTLVQNVQPCIAHILKKAPNPAVVISVVRLYNHSSATYGIDFISKQLLPLVTPLLMIDNLDTSQFQELMGIIRQLLTRVEKERMAVLTNKVMYNSYEVDASKSTADWQAEFDGPGTSNSPPSWQQQQPPPSTPPSWPQQQQQPQPPPPPQQAPPSWTMQADPVKPPQTNTNMQGYKKPPAPWEQQQSMGTGAGMPSWQGHAAAPPSQPQATWTPPPSNNNWGGGSSQPNAAAQSDPFGDLGPFPSTQSNNKPAPKSGADPFEDLFK